MLAKKYKQFVKKTKKEYYKKLANTLRKMKSDNPKQYWDIINKSSNKQNANACPVPLEDFFNHFMNLNQTNNNDQDSFDPRQINHSINMFINEDISLAEVLTARNKLKNKKACGIDNIINEFIKNCPDNVLVLFKLFNLVLNTGLIPSEWNVGFIIPLYKNKGMANDPNNYRGITLLSSIGKLFTSIINTRLTDFINNIGLLGEDQAGFRAGYSTTDHIFTLSCIIDIYLQNKKRVYCAFVDYKKAFDLVNRSAWSKLISNGINGKVINVIFNLYKNAKSCVKVINNISPLFNCNMGVRQGENLSPLLFAIFLNDLESTLRKDNVQGLNFINQLIRKHLSDDDVEMWLRLYVLLYADDTIILTESSNDLQCALNSLKSYCSTWDLAVNTSKTKIVIFSKGKVRNKPTFYFGNDTIEVCDDYTYLGVIFNYNGNFKKAINKQVCKARQAMFALSLKQQNFTYLLMLLVISLTKLFSQFYCTAVKFGASKM